MSEVYIQEPATKGSAVLRTTHGDLEIEMWATECPKACRNFCQLILEGYYNDTIFHRVIKDFIIQGGDKTGTGDGTESIYGEPYPDEIHPRLKFRYRGMMGIASAGAGSKTNGSQFFVVMDRTPSLDRKHTLFAKVVGQTIYNLVRLTDVEVDKHDRPVDPPRIIRAELTWDPFEDLEPRFIPQEIVLKKGNEKHRREAIKNKRILSFGGDDDEENSDDDAKVPSKALSDAKSFGKARSAQEALSEAKSKGGSSSKRAKPSDEKPAEKSPSKPAAASAPPAKPPRRKVDLSDSESGEKGSEKESEKSSSEDSSGDEAGGPKKDKSTRRNEEIEKLKREIVNTRAGDKPAPEKAAKKSAWEELLAGFKTRGQTAGLMEKKDKKGRMAAVVGVVKDMKSFKDKIRDVAPEEKVTTDDIAPEVKARKEAAEEGALAAIWEEGAEGDDDTDWLSGGGLSFHDKADADFRVASKKEKARLEIFDPLAAMGKTEMLEEDRKRRAQQLKPSLKRPVSSLKAMPEWGQNK